MDESGSPGRWSVVVVCAGTAVGLWRQGGRGALDTVWAEDGQVFLSQAVLDPVGSLVTSYAGYYHVLPRLLAVTIAQLPASWAAAALALSAALITSVFAVAAFHLSAEYLPSPLGQLIISAPVAVLPLSRGDVLNSPANLHWTGLYLLFWLLLCRPASGPGKAFALLGIALVAGSDILAGCYLPLAGSVLWLHRDRYALGKALAFGTALAAQLAGLLSGASRREGLQPDLLRPITGYLARVTPTALFGERWVGTEVNADGLMLAATAWLLVAAVLVVAWRRGSAPGWPIAATAALHSVALYAAPVALSGVATPRYAVAPALLLLVSLVALLLPDRAPVLVLGALLLVSCLVNLRVDNPRGHGPAWSDELDHARDTCATEGIVHVRIAPANPGWLASVSCDYLRRK